MLNNRIGRAIAVAVIAGATFVNSGLTFAHDMHSADKFSGRPYHDLILRHAKAHGVPAALAHAVVRIESNYNAKARGRAGEIGLMQIKPTTAKGLGYKGSTKALYSPDTNLAWGMKYLAGAYKRAGGDLCGTILRYNAGHYAKRMNPVSSRYCGKVKTVLASVE